MMALSKVKRRWFQFRLRTLLVLVLLAGLPLGWIAHHRQLARHRQVAVAELDRLKVYVYQYEPTALGRVTRRWPALDRLVRRGLGDDFLSSPSAINAVEINDARVPYLVERLKLFPELRVVHVGSLSHESREQLSREFPRVELRSVPTFWGAFAD